MILSGRVFKISLHQRVTLGGVSLIQFCKTLLQARSLWRRWKIVWVFWDHDLVLKMSTRTVNITTLPWVHLTLRGDLARANEVALITDEDDWSLWLSLPQEKSELSGAVETTPVSHWKHQDAHLTQQSRQVLRDSQRQTHSMLECCSRHVNVLWARS